MPNPTLSEALREAYAAAPADVVILHTLELRHPSFVDDEGEPMAIRVVRDNTDLTARLEAGAPLDAGEMVTFIAMGFDLELPPVDTAPVPEISITLDNVSREIVRHLDGAAESQDVIEVTYRPYLSTDLEGPQMEPPITLVLTEVTADVFRVTGRARMLDVGNKAFPAETYILPGDMDGVSTFNGFPGIKPGQTFTYRFPLRQTGTYWYHAHSGGQEQDGLYGAMIVAPKGKDPIRADKDYVVVLSDFTEEHSSQVMANLKKDSEYYATARRTVGDFVADVKAKGFGKAWENAKSWGQMRMAPTDLADVTGYTFLVNGKSPEGNWTGLFKPGEKVRLRFINASAMSFFDVRIPGLKMDVVQADGQNVEPVPVDEFRFAPAETYDVLVTPQEAKAYTIAAEPIDRTGFALATLAPKDGMRGEIPAQRPRALLTMADMGMDHDMPGMEDMVMTPADMVSGWAKAGTPPGDKMLDYADLRYAGIQKDTRDPGRTIDVRLGGNMERYIWTLNGKKFSEAEPIRLKYGERVRLTFTNETMMAHPMHLHGMFVQLENGQPKEKLPNKHTVIVPPGKSYSVLVTADEAGEWAFHCHLLYHMMSGMMNKVVVAKLDAADIPPTPAPQPQTGGAHHGH